MLDRKLEEYLNAINPPSGRSPYCHRRTTELINKIEEQKPEHSELTELLGREFPPEAFKLDVYRALLPIALEAALSEHAGDANVPEEQKAKIYAAKLTLAFGDKNAALSYLKKFEELQHDHAKQMSEDGIDDFSEAMEIMSMVDKIMHNACLFSLADGKDWTPSLWQAMAKEHMPNTTFEKILPFANKLENYVKDHQADLAESIFRKMKEESLKSFEEDYHKHQKQSDEKEALPELNPQKINKIFSNYLLTEIMPEKGPLSEDDKKHLSERMKHLTAADLRKLEEIKEEELSKLKKKSAPLEEKLDHYLAKRLKQVEENLQKSAKVKAASLLSPRMSLADLQSYASRLSYQKAEQNPEAAKILFKLGLSESSFDKYLELKVADDEKAIPPIGNFSLSDHPGYYLKKLDPHNPKAAALGKLTSCCQSIGEEGTMPAIFGITDPNAGFYVLCKGDPKTPEEEDNIVAQCLAWRSQSNELVFDSIESQVNFRAKNMDIITHFYLELARKLVKEHQVPRVLVGTAGETPKKLIKGRRFPIPMAAPINYHHYRDSLDQVILADAKWQHAWDHFNKVQNLDAELKDPALFQELLIVAAYHPKAEAKYGAFLLALSPNLKKEQLDDLVVKTRETIGLLSQDEINWTRIRELIDAGIPPTILSRDKEPLIHLATADNQLNLLKYLLEDKKLDPNTVDDMGLNLPAKSILRANPEVASYINTFENEFKSEINYPILIYQLFRDKKITQLRELIQAKNIKLSELNITDWLDDAISYQSPDLLRLALEQGLDPNLSWRSPAWSPLQRVIFHFKHEEYKNKEKPDPIKLQQAEEACLAMIKILKEAGAKLISDDKNRLSILSEAMDSNNPKILELIASEENINLPLNEFDTPLIHAVAEHPAMVSILLAKGADPDLSVPGSFRVPPLHRAVLINSHPEVVQQLCEAGANVNLMSPDGSTPLLNAYQYTSYEQGSREKKNEIIETLVRYGANVEEVIALGPRFEIRNQHLRSLAEKYKEQAIPLPKSYQQRMSIFSHEKGPTEQSQQPNDHKPPEPQR